LRCDVEVVTAEKISLQELHHTELQKWKETASENKRECTVLLARVAQQEMKIADLTQVCYVPFGHKNKLADIIKAQLQTSPLIFGETRCTVLKYAYMRTRTYLFCI
jgi:hypothetical protein